MVLISLDGCRPDAIAEADAPHLDALIAAGVQSSNARTIEPYKTLPCHISMLSGATAARHGVLENEFVDPLPTPAVPTVFDAVDQAGRDALMIVGKYKLLALRSGHYAPLDQAVAVLKRETRHRVPDFIFIHSAEPDLSGHAEGWMSPTYQTAIGRADRMVGEVIDWVRSKGLWDRSLILITADHGGYGKTHRGDHEEDKVIPWIASGGMVRCRSLADGVRIHDTAPTVLTALGLPIDKACEGKSITALFEPEPQAAARAAGATGR